jgi:hypothetical protein
MVVGQKQTTMALTYGTNVYDRSFQGQVNTLDSFQIGRPMQYIGLGVNGHFVINEKARVAGHFIFGKYLPQQIHFNDSTKAKLSGSTFGFGYGFDCFNKAKNIDFILSAGLNLGRMKLTQATNSFSGEKVELSIKNMFISPKASAMLTLYIQKISLSFNAEYGYDISASGWKPKLLSNQESSLTVPGYNQSGLGFSVGIGRAF